MREIVAKPGVWYANDRILALGHPCFIFALIATGWMFVVPVVTVGVTIAPIIHIHTPWNRIKGFASKF